MNRNYLPPALKIQNNYFGGFNLSPPSVVSTSYNSSNNNYPVGSSSTLGSTTQANLGSSTVTANSAVALYNNRRFYGKSSKLPPVQEVGKLL